MGFNLTNDRDHGFEQRNSMDFRGKSDSGSELAERGYLDVFSQQP